MDTEAEHVYAHRLSIPARPQALETLSGWLAQLKEACGWSDTLAYRLELVLTEVATNVIEHGGEGMPDRADGEHRIELACDCADGAVRALVADDGLEFDPTQYPESALPDSLDEASPGGLGVFMMRRYTSALHYRREGGRNILSLTFSPGAEVSPTRAEQA